MGCVTCGSATSNGWFVFFLNEPLKDDFMSGYSQMAGLAATSLA